MLSCKKSIASPDGDLVVNDDHIWLTYPSAAARYQTLTEAWQAGSQSLQK